MEHQLGQKSESLSHLGNINIVTAGNPTIGTYKNCSVEKLYILERSPRCCSADIPPLIIRICVVQVQLLGLE